MRTADHTGRAPGPPHTSRSTITTFSANSATFTIGQAGSFSVTTSGVPVPTVTIGGETFPLPAPFLTADPAGVYRADNHAWLFATSGGRVFHAGPSAANGWLSGVRRFGIVWRRGP